MLPTRSGCRQLAPVDLKSIDLHWPLPFSVVDKNGVLLAKKGFVFGNEKTLLELANHGDGFYVDFSDMENTGIQGMHKAYVDRLLSAVRKQSSVGDIARLGVRYSGQSGIGSDEAAPVDWRNLVQACQSLLGMTNGDQFASRLGSIVRVIAEQVDINPDDMLLCLFYLSAHEKSLYSATHSLLVSAISALTAKEVLHWPAEDIALLIRASLTMNIGMATLQDALAQQKVPPDAHQRQAIDRHAQRSVESLTSLGVDDALWLEIVRKHHIQVQDPLHVSHKFEALVGLIQRADVFAARLAPRATRQPSSNSQAMKAIFFDAKAQMDGAGTALIKAVGIYHPGSYVKLYSGEVAVVIRRGVNTKSPDVAVVLNKQGVPVVDPIHRKTADKAYSIQSAIRHSEIKVDLCLGKLLKLNRIYRAP